MKVRIEHVDEAFSSAGYVSHSFDDISGFSYNILPLQFNLQQKGNTKPNDKGVFKYYVGDYVTGICEYDDNQHNGIIKHLFVFVKQNFVEFAKKCLQFANEGGMIYSTRCWRPMP